MTTVIPKSPRELASALARRLASAAVIFGLAVGGVAYAMASRRADQAALARVVESARHFEAPAMRLVGSAAMSGGHTELGRLLDRTRFVGIHIFSPWPATVISPGGPSTTSPRRGSPSTGLDGSQCVRRGRC